MHWTLKRLNQIGKYPENLEFEVSQNVSENVSISTKCIKKIKYLKLFIIVLVDLLCFGPLNNAEINFKIWKSISRASKCIFRMIRKREICREIWASELFINEAVLFFRTWDHKVVILYVPSKISNIFSASVINSSASIVKS